jgi:hypothetical protein
MVALAIIVVPGFAEIPDGVSPGAVDRIAEIEGRCPTFSWGSVAGARWYELEVFRLGEEGEEMEPVLRQSFAGSASSWTPSLDLCLELGGRYAWWVRAEGEKGPGEWSDPLWFTVSLRVTETEFREALEMVRAYLAAAGEPYPQAEDGPRQELKSGGPPAVAQSSSGSPAKALPTSVPTAIKGMASGTSGMTFGVHGISVSTSNGSAGVVGQSTAGSGVTHGVVGHVQSSAGVAGVFDNTAGGQILGGYNNGSEVFSVAGTGAVSAASFAGDGAGLTDVVATDLSCTDCVDGSEIATGAVGTSEVGDNSLTAGDLGPDSVGSSEIADNSVTVDDLGPNSVGTSEVVDSSLTASDLAPSSVGTSEVEDNSLTASDLAPNSVGSSEVVDNSLTVNDLGTNSVGTSEVVDNSLTAIDLAPNSVGSSEVMDNSLTANDLAPNSVTPSEIVTGGVGMSEIASGAVGISEMQGSFCFVKRGTNSCPSGYTPYYIRWDTEDLANDDYCGTPATSCASSTITLYFCCK